jgi:excisionase family DNA binding protein
MKQPFTVQIFSHEPMTLDSSTSLSKTTNYQLMTDKEVSTYLNVCRRSLYNWRKAGLIPYIKLGKSVRFRVNEVEAALKRMSRES